MYHLLTAYFYRKRGYTGVEAKADKHYENAMSLYSEAKELDKHSYKNTKAEIKSEFKVYVSSIRMKIAKRIREEIDKSTPKITIDKDLILPMASVCATLFLISGYAYSHLLLDEFNIEVTDFYGVGDYISSSLNKLSLAAVATLFSMFFYLVGMYDLSLIHI